MNKEIFTTIFVSLSQRLDYCHAQANSSEDEEAKDYWSKASAKTLEAREFIVKKA